MRYIISLVLFLTISTSAHAAEKIQITRQTALAAKKAKAIEQFDPCNPGDYRSISETYKTGLFFRISKCVDGEKIRDSYVLGTMHSDLPQVRTSIPNSVWAVLAQSKSASFELKNDSTMQEQVVKAMYYDASSGMNLRSAIGDEMYAELGKTLEGKRDDLSVPVCAKMRPWAIGLLMQVPADESDGVHLDLLLEKFATDKTIPVFGLETAEEQLSVFTKLSPEEQIQFLREAIDSFNEVDRINDKMLKDYLERNLTSLQALAVESFDMMKDEALREKLKKTLITDRNLVMVQRMEPHLAEGNAFVAIGALHLPTEEGILSLLEKGGYYIHVVND